VRDYSPDRSSAYNFSNPHTAVFADVLELPGEALSAATRAGCGSRTCGAARSVRTSLELASLELSFRTSPTRPSANSGQGVPDVLWPIRTSTGSTCMSCCGYEHQPVSRRACRFELRKFHATLEEGGTTFNSAQSLYQAAGATNPGTFTAPIFGQTLDLGGLAASYGITGSSTYTKALFSSNALFLDGCVRAVPVQPAQFERELLTRTATGIFILAVRRSWLYPERASTWFRRRRRCRTRRAAWARRSGL